MLFQVVGVQFDKARQQPFAAQVHGAGGHGGAPVHCDDPVAAYGDAAGEDFIRGDNAGIGENLFHAQAPASTGATSKVREPTASRTSWS